MDEDIYTAAFNDSFNEFLLLRSFDEVMFTSKFNHELNQINVYTEIMSMLQACLIKQLQLKYLQKCFDQILILHLPTFMFSICNFRLLIWENRQA